MIQCEINIRGFKTFCSVSIGNSLWVWIPLDTPENEIPMEFNRKYGQCSMYLGDPEKQARFIKVYAVNNEINNRLRDQLISRVKRQSIKYKKPDVNTQGF